MELLDSLSLLDYNGHEIFVVDNASTDDSLELLRNHPLRVNLIQNELNLGGTGGFNSGIRHVLNAFECKYIWLLDNDAIVTPLSLKNLVAVMEDDPLIGLAGSRIINRHDGDFIVETGAVIDWQQGTVRAVHRNQRRDIVGAGPPILVDYVAVCSALVRVSALAKVGLMDERYFLFWDDMDWGVAFQRAGYKVVGVPESEVLHPAFTEYRSYVVDNYYGVRNQLLTFAKYIEHEGAFFGIYHLLQRVAKFSLLMMLSCRAGCFLGFLGYWDFLQNKWGKNSHFIPSTQTEPNEKDEIQLFPTLSVLILPLKDVAEVEDLLLYLERKGVENIDLLISKDRKELFSSLKIRRLIETDYAEPKVMINSIKTFLKIMLSGYDIAVRSNPEKISPFTYAVPRAAYFDNTKCRLIKSSENLGNSWRIMLSVFLGELVGCIMFLGFLLKIITMRKSTIGGKA